MRAAESFLLIRHFDTLERIVAVLHLIRLQVKDPFYCFEIYPNANTLQLTPSAHLIVARVFPVLSQGQQGVYKRFTVESMHLSAPFDTFTMEVGEKLFAVSQFQLLVAEIQERLPFSFQTQQQFFAYFEEPYK